MEGWKGKVDKFRGGGQGRWGHSGCFHSTPILPVSFNCCCCLGSLSPYVVVLQELVWKCWEKDPEQRPAMGIVSDVLAKLLSRKGYPARSPSFPTNLSKSAENLLAI